MVTQKGKYQHVLLVTDLGDDCDLVADRATAVIRAADSVQMSVLHVVEETVLTAGYEIVPIVPVGNEMEMVSDARGKIQALLDRHGIETADINIETALSTRRGILDYVENNHPDLIVIGRHKRTGLASLLGATADDILPGVDCDVLVVYLGEPS
ncbi:universal stress protein [Suttonella sp. R2A3]|uniref:universal stress protein n=1 Tax=Suttonella sp. R2A3 TaxID=2908648 RepID=UPI001F3FB869|nr:universal stress protein [Suttonella sp. R2A3]UJF24008.1 universal stress protein [Suttonella sp. R2A3]